MTEEDVTPRVLAGAEKWAIKLGTKRRAGETDLAFVRRVHCVWLLGPVLSKHMRLV